MKILRLKLHNFARVLSGLGKTTVEINLLNVNEHINMFIGENGSGKTSIMRCLHPFAYNGSIGDNTSNPDLIIDGKDGKKEIDILHDGKVYHIEHIYSRKKDGTITVKSFISEDGEELNESGVGIGFKAVVQDKLGVNETFLTLLSVGNSVEGFVELTSANRKNFATKIFAELGVYNTYYKNMNNLARSMNTLLSNVTSKLSRYGSIDKGELSARIEDIKRNLKSLGIAKNELLTQIGGVQAQLDMYRESNQNYMELQRQVNNEMDKIRALESRCVMPGTLENLERRFEEVLQKLSDANNQSSIVDVRIEGSLNTKNDLMNSIATYKSNLDMFKTDQPITNLEEHIASLKSEIDGLSKPNQFKYYAEDITLEELIKANVYLDELTRLVGNLVFKTSDMALIETAVRTYLKDSKKARKVFTTKYENTATKLQSRIVVKSVGDLDLRIKGLCKCDNVGNCPYVDFYNEFMSIVNGQIADTDSRSKQYQEDISYYQTTLECFDCLDMVFDFINKRAELFNKLPREVFNGDFLYQFIENRTIYNQELLIAMVEDKENAKKIEDLRASLNSAKNELSIAKANSNMIASITDQIEHDTNKLNSVLEELEKLYNESESLKHTITELTYQKNTLDQSIDVLRQIKECKDRLNDITEEIRKMGETIATINRLNNTLQEYRTKESSITDSILELENQLRTAQITLTNINTLEQEEIEIREKYDDVMEIRKAVSPVTGIPVEFIEHYVKSEMIDRMNKLLDSVYHGRLRLRGDLVVVNDKEFTIPYQKNNTIVKDISKASDGERAIMTFAFSLVLIQSAMDKYNIMLLDEIDTSLDHYGRSKFISLLETYMDTIHAEQLFLISHNNMFDSYPVNVIMTSEMNLSNMTNKSVIKLYS